MRLLFVLLASLIFAYAANDTLYEDLGTYMGKPFVGAENLQVLGSENPPDPEPIPRSFLDDEHMHLVSRDLNVGKYGLKSVNLWMMMVLTPDGKAWDLGKTTAWFEYHDGNKWSGVLWGAKCVWYTRKLAIYGSYDKGLFFYHSCAPTEPNAPLWMVKDGYTIRNNKRPTIGNVEGRDGTRITWTENELSSKCGDPYCYTRKNKGPNGACCSVQEDCINGCRGDGVCAVCDSKFFAWGEENIPYGGCCGKDSDCAGKCINQRCTDPKCTRTPNLHDGYLGQCCSTDVDCQGKCSKQTCTDASKCTRPKGLQDGNFGDCCSANADCTTASTCDMAIYKCLVSPTYCTGRKLGLGDGKDGDCCKKGTDCISNSCPGGKCIGPIASDGPCLSGMQGTNLAKALDGYCCSAPGDCVNLCFNGICIPKRSGSCTGGSEFSTGGESPAGYCCLNAADSCEGDCINGICGQPKELICSTCIRGHEGDNNKNLFPAFCCSSTSDCLGGCSDGQCGAIPAESCPRPTKTTSTKPTQTGKPDSKNIDIKDIVVGTCTVGCGPGALVPIAIGSWIISVGGGLAGLIGGIVDDDKTTTTTTQRATRTFSMTINTSTDAGTTTSSSTKITNLPIPEGTTSGATVTSGTTSMPVSAVITPVATSTSSVSISSVSSTSTTSMSVTATSVLSSTSSTNVLSTRTSTLSTETSTLSTTSTNVLSSTFTLSTATKSTSITGLPTATVIGKTCKKGYYGKALKNGPDGYCCSATIDCIGACVYVPGDSYMCKDGITSTGVSTGISTGTSGTSTSISVIGTPTGTSCIQGYCGKGTGKGPTGACCSDQWDCDDTCNANGKCGLSDETWTKKLPC